MVKKWKKVKRREFCYFYYMHWQQEFLLVDLHLLQFLNIKHSSIMCFLSSSHSWSWKRWSKKIIVDYRKAMIKAVLHEFSIESLYQYLDRAYNIIYGDSKTDDFSRTFIHVSAYHFLQMERRKIKEILKNSRSNPQIHFLRPILWRLICYTDLEEARRFVKDIYITLTT